MKLFYTPLSPFARKCRIIVLEKNLQDQVELIHTPPLDNPPELLAVNPLGTVPALVLQNGSVLCESPVICEYLDSLAPQPPLFPADIKQRIEVLSIASLGDGIMDAAVACVLENRRPQEKQYDAWITRKQNAIMRTIELLAAIPLDADAPINIGAINTISALSYVSFRMPHLDWRARHLNLARYHDVLSKRPSFAATAPESA